MSDLVSFDLLITKAGQDPVTGEMQWFCTASDVYEDIHKDETAKALYDSFLHRIKSNEEAPKDFQTSFWKGGTPYISISHYSDAGGASVPGAVSSVFLDGAYLKAKGTFSDTALGRAAFKSVRESIKRAKTHTEGMSPVRISIGFLDFKHKHKSNGYVFTRKTLSMRCPECAKESHLKMEEKSGLIYLDGQLIHLALTRVPVNPRTIIEGNLVEVEKSMTTRKEDAASIIGEELAEELETNESEVEPTEKALVTKSDEPLEEVVPVEDIPVEVAPVEVAPVPHVLDAVFSKFKARLDALEKRPENMKPLQENLEEIAAVVHSSFTSKGTASTEGVAAAVLEELVAKVNKSIQDALTPLNMQIAVLSDKLSGLENRTTSPAPAAEIEVRRGITVPTLAVVDPASAVKKAVAPAPRLSTFSQYINQSVGLPKDFVRPEATVVSG